MKDGNLYYKNISCRLHLSKRRVREKEEEKGRKRERREEKKRAER